MMKKILFTCLMLTAIGAMPGAASASGESKEFATKTVSVGQSAQFAAGIPVLTTVKHSVAQLTYKAQINLNKGDLISELVFTGYNPGTSQQRHFTVWVSQGGDNVGGSTMFSTEGMKKVYDGNCVIRHGGTEQEPTDILSFQLDEPLVYEHAYYTRIVVESEGEAGNEVFFEQQNTSVYTYYARMDEDGKVRDSQKVAAPVLKLTAKTPVAWMSGKVTNQEGKPVEGALVEIRGYYSYSGVTDSNGKYGIRIEEGNGECYLIEVSSPGHACYADNAIRATYLQLQTADFTLNDRITYKAGKCSSIILPVQPDASVGKYYRLDRLENRNLLVFERETQPMANVPYLIVPYKDYVVDISQFDLTGEPGIAKASMPVDDPERWGVPPEQDAVEVVFFCGSYRDEIWMPSGSYYYFFADDAPSCGLFYEDEQHGCLKYGACHAAILIKWQAVKSNELRLQLVDSDGSATYVCPTGIEEMKDEIIKMNDSAIYDLQGRNVQGSKLNAQSLELPKGIYIVGGRKVAVK